MKIVTSADVARVAAEAVAARKAGKRSVTISGITFDLETGGYCARFVRQCHEAALGRGEWTWGYNAPTAYDMERRLQANAAIVGTPAIGDIVGLSTSCRPPGHIAIYAGDGHIYENTSAVRGDPRAPGTKRSPLDLARVTHYYRVLPQADAPAPLRVVLLPGSCVVGCSPEIADGVTRCDLRPLAEALGYEVIAEHIPTQNKIYLRKA